MFITSYSKCIQHAHLVLKLVIYCTQGKHASHYTSGAVQLKFEEEKNNINGSIEGDSQISKHKKENLKLISSLNTICA